LTKVKGWVYIILGLIITSFFLITTQSDAVTHLMITPSQPTPTGHIATEDELALAHAEWSQSAHSDTYDDGMGANTTCARCKSPMNWDPTQELAQLEATDCGSCKRIPGAPRPELRSGIVVEEKNWHDITCDVCHIPAGDSYFTDVAFWNQALEQYEAVDNVMELCAHCHEGRHGFEVIEEQLASSVHTSMDCTECHSAHGGHSLCEDCHNPAVGQGAFEHLRHPNVHCSGCHDDGGLSIWYESDPQSSYYGEYITRRFAHTLTSWPSHDLAREVYCQRCHHPLENRSTSIVPYVRCDKCHEHSSGAVFDWCIFFERDPNPNAPPTNEP
jgi:hypothetical protein